MGEYITNEYKKKPLNTVLTGETGRMGHVKDKWLKDQDEIICDYVNNKMSRDVALARLRNIGVGEERATQALDEVDTEHDARQREQQEAIGKADVD